MSDILGHEHVWERFRRAHQRGRIAGSYLFIGPSGIGKRTLAVELAKTLLCANRAPGAFAACGTCPPCRQVDARTHPDLLLLSKPADRSFIPLDLLIGDREHRMREGLCHDVWLKPFSGRGKVAIIDDADFFNEEGANCLLKTLEEPPPHAMIILIGTSLQRQLPTIRSRCQVIRFQALTDAQVARLLMQKHFVDDAATAQQLAAHAGGSVEAAEKLIDDPTTAMRATLCMQLATADFDSVKLAQAVTRFIETVGKDAPPRRARLRRLLQQTQIFYRLLMRTLVDPDTTLQPDLAPAVRRALPHWTGNAELAAICLERCLAARVQLDSSANVATLVATWIDDLAQHSPPVAMTR